MFWELIYVKPNPFSAITTMTQQQAIFWFNIACNNHNPDGTDYDIHRFYIHTCIIQILKFIFVIWDNFWQCNSPI